VELFEAEFEAGGIAFSSASTAATAATPPAGW